MYNPKANTDYNNNRSTEAAREHSKLCVCVQICTSVRGYLTPHLIISGRENKKSERVKERLKETNDRG